MRFSITIPAYKAKYLQECIESILAQTYADFELIIVNDASPEDLDSIVQKYTDLRIRYYTNKKNCGAIGVVDNWNICLSYAKGDYIVCMGDDDVLAPDFLEEYNKLMVKYPDLDLYHARVKVIDEHSEFLDYQEARPEYESVYSMIYHRMKGRIQFIGDFLFKTSTLKENGGFYKLPLAWASDDISAYIAATEKGVANTYKPTFFYRKNSLTISSTGSTMIKMNAIKLEQEWYTKFLSTYEPMCEMDKNYRNIIRKKLNLFFLKKKVNTVSNDIVSAPISRFIYWILKRKQHNIPFKGILYALINALKIKASIK